MIFSEGVHKIVVPIPTTHGPIELITIEKYRNPSMRAFVYTATLPSGETLSHSITEDMLGQSVVDMEAMVIDQIIAAAKDAMGVYLPTPPDFIIADDIPAGNIFEPATITVTQDIDEDGPISIASIISPHMREAILKDLFATSVFAASTPRISQVNRAEGEWSL